MASDGVTGDPAGWPIERVREEIASSLPVAGLFGFEIDSLDAAGCTILIPDGPNLRRPGGSVAGPVLFAAADVGCFALVLTRNGPGIAATVDLIVHFLRPADRLPLVARTVPVRFGRRLATFETSVAARDAPDRMVARATATWVVGT